MKIGHGKKKVTIFSCLERSGQSEKEYPAELREYPPTELTGVKEKAERFDLLSIYRQKKD